MDLRGRNILIISPEAWRGLHMSKHHVAQGLVDRGNRVFWWGPVRDHHDHVPPPEKAGVQELFARHWLKGVNRLPLAVNRWYYGRIIRELEEQAGVRFDIIWCFDTSRMQVFPRHPAFRLLHLVDYDILYSGHGLMRSADLIVSTADSINDKVRTIAPGVPLHKVGHALDARWLKGAEALMAPRSATPGLAVYSGQFYNTYIDWDALETVALEHPAIQFRYIGNVDPDYPSDAFQRLRRLPNVEFTGLVTKDDLIPRVREADILFFCFMTDRKLLERANPHKVLEYLSTGNVIVGSRTLEYDGRNDLMLQSHERRDFALRFAEAVRDFATLNTAEARALRIGYAQERTIGHLLDHVQRLVRDVWPPHRHQP